MLTREACGLAVPPGDAAQLAAAVRRLADDPDEAAAMGRRGRQLVEHHYGWTTIVERWLAEIGVAGAAAPCPLSETTRSGIEGTVL
jgi:glycosyltransferase involved in cell wall biosynthesis